MANVAAEPVGRSALAWSDRATWFVGLGNTLALAGQSAAFWIVGALTGAGGLDDERASRIAAIELITMGVMMILLSPMVHRLPRRATIVAAVALIVAMQVCSVFALGYWPLLLIRAMAGIGFGTLFAMASAIGAATPLPERTFALAGSISLAIGTAFNPLLGFGSLSGAAGVFLALTAICVGLAIPLLVLTLGRANPNVAVRAPERVRGGVPKLPAIGVMAIMALMAGATNGVFVFVAKIAGAVGVGGPSMGTAMAGVSLFSASGGLIASRIGTRYGTLPPLIAGLLSIGAMLCWLANAASAAAFWISFTSVVTLYWFTFPYILGLASRADRFGRVASATGTAKILAAGGGTAIAGTVAERIGIGAYGIVALGFTVVAVLIAPLVVAAVGRAHPDEI